MRRLFFIQAVSIMFGIFELFTRGRNDVWIPYLIIIPILLTIPRLLYVRFWKNKVTPQWLAHQEIGLLLALVVNIPGPLRFHELGIQYDRFLHFSSLLIGTYLAMLASLAILATTDSISRYRFTLGCAVFGILAWEGLQWTVDHVFGTHLFFDAAQSIVRDFWEDALFGSLGSLLTLAYFWNKQPRLLKLYLLNNTP